MRSDLREGTGISQDSSQTSKQSAVQREVTTDGKNEEMSVTDHRTHFTFMRLVFFPGQAESDVSPQGHTWWVIFANQLLTLKVQSMILMQYTFCQIQRISPHGPLAFCSVCVLKKWSGVHTQPWLCKLETDRAAQVEPPTQDVKYRHFSHVSTEHFI